MVVWTVSGTGAALVSAPENLDDGAPDTLTAFTFNTGAQTHGDHLPLARRLDVRSDRARIGGFSNLLLPPGTKLQMAFRRPGDAAATYPYVPAMENNGQRIVLGDMGERRVWILVKTGAVPVIGVEYQIINDVNGVASLPPGLPFQGGEAVITAGTDMPIDKEWGDDPIDPTVVNYSPNRQPYPDPGTPYRQLDFKMPLARMKQVYGDPADASALDYKALFAKMNRGQTCVYVTRYLDEAGVFSAQLLHDTAMLGIATKLPKLNHKAGPLFVSDSGTIIESPIPV